MANRFCKNASKEDEETLIEDLLKTDFEETFNEFLEKFDNTEVDALNFPEAYVVFLGLARKKYMYIIPYTKFFIINLLKNTPNEKKDEAKLIVEMFFKEMDLSILPEIQKVL